MGGNVGNQEETKESSKEDLYRSEFGSISQDKDILNRVGRLKMSRGVRANLKLDTEWWKGVV